MEIRNETKWLCQNARTLEGHSGKWVMFDAQQGFVRQGPSLATLLQKASLPGEAKRFVLHVPSKQELLKPRFIMRRD